MRISFFIFFLLLTLKVSNLKAAFIKEDEIYDPSLKRLNSIQKLNFYIDSCAQAQNIAVLSKDEVLLVNHVVEQKFYHGYSYYTSKDNWIAYLAGKYIWDHLSAIVIPADLVKHPMAACSQQAIVMMDLLKHRGYRVRKLGLTGHFILEVYYDQAWHMFDPDKEPIYQGISHDSLDVFLNNGYLYKAYSRTDTPESVKAIFSKRMVGKVNEFPAKNVRLFHLVTGYITENLILLILTIIMSSSILVKKLKKYYANKNRFKLSEQKRAVNCTSTY